MFPAHGKEARPQMVGRPQFMRGISKLFSVLIIGAMFALPGAAMAQSSSEGGYIQPGGTVKDEIQTRPAQATDNTPAAATTRRTLER